MSETSSPTETAPAAADPATAATPVAVVTAAVPSPNLPAPKPLHPSVWAAITSFVSERSHEVAEAVDRPEVMSDIKAAFAFLSSAKGIALLTEIGSVLAMAGGPVASQTWSALAGVMEKFAALLDEIPAAAVTATAEPAAATAVVAETQAN